MKKYFVLFLALGLIGGCGKKEEKPGAKPAVSGDVPSYSLAWSEYPSWSVFGVAHEHGLINGKKGELGPIEKKWNVDIELKEADYDSCLMMYGAGKCNAVCITNMDVLSPSLGVQSVAVMPTSTSYGGDACIVTDKIKNIKDLQKYKVYGLAKTVSEYCFARNLEILKEQESKYKFTNQDPGAAALAMQQGQNDAIVVWNPFVLETLNKNKNTRVLFDSTSIPGEIIDMLVVSQKTLDQKGGKEFACAMIDTFYQVNKMIDDKKTRDQTLIDLGSKFSHLDLKSMEKVVKQTRFYSTPAMGIALFTMGNSFPGNEVKNQPDLKSIMTKVVDFCVSHAIVDKKPAVSYGTDQKAEKSNLRFDPSYMKSMK